MAGFDSETMVDIGSYKIWKRIIFSAVVLVALLIVNVHFLPDFRKDWQYAKATCDNPPCCKKGLCTKLNLEKSQDGDVALKNEFKLHPLQFESQSNFTIGWPPRKARKAEMVVAPFYEKDRQMLMFLIWCVIGFLALTTIFNLIFSNHDKWKKISAASHLRRRRFL